MEVYDKAHPKARGDKFAKNEVQTSNDNAIEAK
jgi:hypothetical protein